MDPNSQRWYYLEQATGRTQWEIPQFYPQQGPPAPYGAPVHGYPLQPYGAQGQGYPPHGMEGHYGAGAGVLGEHERGLGEGEKKGKGYGGVVMGAVGGLAAGALLGHAMGTLVIFHHRLRGLR